MLGCQAKALTFDPDAGQIKVNLKSLLNPATCKTASVLKIWKRLYCLSFPNLPSLALNNIF